MSVVCISRAKRTIERAPERVVTQPVGEPAIESEYPSPAIVDSRRLMGPNLFAHRVGAVLDVQLDDASPARADALLLGWHARARECAAALEWSNVFTAQRRYAGGASLFVAAPVDQLMAATELAEHAWVFAESQERGVVRDANADLQTLLLFARDEQARHADGTSRLGQLASEAARLHLNLMFDDETVSVGTGIGSQTWPVSSAPSVADIDWLGRHDVPIVLVSGSNGKTTVVRMLVKMARAAGHTVGYSCTDGVWIDTEQVASGDYSGPAGARRVLRDTSVTFAVLETARGGILRRGLAVQHASAAVIVTIAEDHFGSYGINSLDDLAEVKLVLTRALGELGTLIFNRDVPALQRAVAHASPARSVSVSIERPQSLSSDELAQIPATLGVATSHNALNALLACATGDVLDLGPAARAALLTFGADADDNVGRLMLKKVGDVSLVVDYAHNAQSVAALIDATRAIPAPRRAIALGTGGDRDDTAVRAMARAAHASGVIDFYISKEMPNYLRGRALGSLSGVLLDELTALQVPASRRTSAPDDMSAARLALQWAQRGDLLLLGVHDQRADVLAFLDFLAASGWRAGAALPAAVVKGTEHEGQ